MTPNIPFQTISANGINLRAAVVGSGPLLVLVHGFPESWAAWRHQIIPLAQLGFKVAAIDLRGYGGSDKPHDISDYSLNNMTRDIVGVIDALGAGKAILIGHDWGAHLVWTTALAYPEKVSALAALSVPFSGVPAEAPSVTFRRDYADLGYFFYQNYFQQPGVAEEAFERDIDDFVRRFYFWLSGEAGGVDFTHKKPAESALLDLIPRPQTFPAWMDDGDIAYLVSQFQQGGLQGPLNRYRNYERDQLWLEQFSDRTIYHNALYIVGDRDLVLTMRPGVDRVAKLRSMVPNLEEVVVLPGVGHWTQQEAPEAVTANLSKWLKSYRSVA